MQQKAGTMRATEFLAELWTQPYELTSRVTGPANMEYYFNTKDNRPGRIVFDSFLDTDDGGLHVVLVIVHFYIDNLFHTSGKGDSIAIFSTVVAACRDYLRRYKPPVVSFETDDPKKRNLYVKMSGMFPDYVIYPYPQWGQDPVVGDEIFNSLMDGNAKDAVVLHRRNYDPKKTRMYIDEKGVAEAFDQPYNLKWEKGDHGNDHDALVLLPDGTYLTIMFNEDDEDQYSVEFWRGHSQSVTGEGDSQRIFSTVLAAIAEFIKKYHPRSLAFTAAKEDESEETTNSRTKLYDRLVQRYASGLGYRVDRWESGYGVNYELTKLKQSVAEDENNGTPTVGINVRTDGDIDYASLIVDGKKKYESRKSDSLRPYVGKTVGIVRTGSGPAVAIGQVTIGEPIVVDIEKFNKLRKQHLVPQGSKFDIDVDGTKYLYPMINPIRWDNEKLIKHKGIVSRKITELYEPESSFPLHWYHSNDPREQVARAYDRKKGYIDIKFTPVMPLEFNDMVEVEFSRNDSYDMTGQGDAARVLGTVLQAFREYLKGYQPKILLFAADGDSRNKVYQNLIKRFATGAGYKQFDTNKLSKKMQEKLTWTRGAGGSIMILTKMQ